MLSMLLRNPHAEETEPIFRTRRFAKWKRNWRPRFLQVSLSFVRFTSSPGGLWSGSNSKQAARGWFPSASQFYIRVSISF